MTYKLKPSLILLVFFWISLCAAAEEIHDVAKKGDVTKVQETLERDPELVNARDSGFRRTPLHWAARGVHPEVIKLLVEKGADVKATDGNGVTALHSVIARGHKEAAKFLVSRGADVNAVDGTDNTPLSYAITGGHVEIAGWLEDRGAAVPLRGEVGRRLLHSSASQGNKALVDWMFAQGIDFSSPNSNGGTLLHSASEGGLAEFIERLTLKGLWVNQKDRYGFSPLHYAAKNGHRGVVEALLRNKAEINAPTLTGETPVHLALLSGERDLAEFLIVQGASPDPPEFPILKEEYLGMKKPGRTPEIFAPGIVSSIDWEHSAPDFSPDGQEVYWASISGQMRIVSMKIVEGKWTAPSPAAFTGFEDCYPRFSHNGDRLYFISYRPLEEGEKNPGFGVNLWFVERLDVGWSNPKPVGYPFDTGNIFGFSMTMDGTIYYTDGGGSSFDVFMSKFVDGRYNDPERLSDVINSEHPEDEPYIAPDESYLIFKSMKPGGYGGADLYISFQRQDGSWTKAKNMGPKINTKYAERFPSVSRDGRFIFFGSDRNGNRGDIYWMDAGIIEKLEKRGKS